MDVKIDRHLFSQASSNGQGDKNSTYHRIFFASTLLPFKEAIALSLFAPWFTWVFSPQTFDIFRDCNEMRKEISTFFFSKRIQQIPKIQTKSILYRIARLIIEGNTIYPTGQGNCMKKLFDTLTRFLKALPHKSMRL